MNIRDKKMVWKKILKASLNTPSLKCIKEFESTEDSRAVWKLLVKRCKGQDATKKCVLLATRVLSLIPNGGEELYSNEYQFSFEKYSAKLQEAYSTLTRYQNFVPAQFCVQRMLDGIQVSNVLTIDMAKGHVLDNILADWLGSVSYMSAKVEIQFLPRLGGGRNRKDDYRIYKLYSNRRRGRGRGRGHRQVRGGRNGHHSGSNRNDPDNGWFHGVDCSDFRRRFYGESFDKSGSDGRMCGLNKRKSDKETRHIHKVQQVRKDYRKELALVPYSSESTGNNNSGGNENPNESKEHIAAQGKGKQADRRFGQGAYKPKYKSLLLFDE